MSPRGMTTGSMKMLSTRPLTAGLEREHRSMAMAVYAMYQAACHLDADTENALRAITRSLDVLIELGDHCHHGKEERVLVPALWADESLRVDRELDELLDEHKRGRDLLLRIKELAPACAADEQSRRDLLETATAYKALTYYHMRRESAWLFPLVERRLALQGPIIQRRMRALEERFGGTERHRKLTEAARELRQEAILMPAGRR